MIRRGEKIVACDPDLLDAYLCTAAEDGDETRGHVLCVVDTMLRYPIQHAILDWSIANENPPIPFGARCRLKFMRRAGADDLPPLPYADSVSRCRAEYARKRRGLYCDLADFTIPAESVIQRPSPEEFAILDRHALGVYHGRRALIDH